MTKKQKKSVLVFVVGVISSAYVTSAILVLQSVEKVGPRKSDAKGKVSWEIGVPDGGSSGGSLPARGGRLAASSSLSPLFRTFERDEDQLDR